jgi:diguanylate cyclase (GGDEF)-like protein/PAS domain S-box-containing protein
MTGENKKVPLSVLYVEDEAVILLAIKDSLALYVENVYSAKNGVEGLALFKEYMPDIVVTDVKMPEMNGLEMSKEIRKISPKVPILITTAYSDIDFLIESINIGVNQYILKPIEIERLVHSLQKVCDVLMLSKSLDQTRSLLTEYKHAIDASTIVFKMDAKGEITYVNEEFCRVSKYSKQDLIGQHYKVLISPEESLPGFETIWKALSKEKIWKGIQKKRAKDGVFYYVDTTIVPIMDMESDVLQYISISYDVTDLIQKEEELEKRLYVDKLTELSNRAKLLLDLESTKYSALILINLDYFKEINDFYGTEVGDFILAEVGIRISSVINSEFYKLYKMPSDEYALLVFKMKNVNEVEKVAYQIRGIIMDKPFVYLDSEIHIAVTQGIAQEDHSLKNSVSRLLLKTDMALKKAKSLGKPLVVYNDSLNIFQEYEKNIQWTKKLKEAIVSDRIVPYFQPIVNNLTGKIEKYESLVRFIDKDGSVVPPIHFLDISKKNRLYPNITKIMVQKTIETFEKCNYEFSINLSVKDIMDVDTVNFIKDKLMEFPKVKNRIVFEILESEGIENYDEVIVFIFGMKSFGCKIAIDDFGAGYSNFDHIMRLNVDYIKIDSSLIKNIDTENNAQMVTRFIVEFARSLGKKTISEFVCSKEIYEKVKELGVDYSQGYYFGKPEPFILGENIVGKELIQ